VRDLLGLLEEAGLQIRLENVLKKKCDRSGKCDVGIQAKCASEKHSIRRKVCEEKAQLEKGLCEENEKLEGKVYVAAVNEMMHVLLKKIQPDALCGRMNVPRPICPVRAIPRVASEALTTEPQHGAPVERRLTQSQRQLYDFSDLKTAALEEFLQGLMEKYVLPKEQDGGSDKLYTFANVILHVLKNVFHEDAPQDPTGVPVYDKCGLDLQCKLMAQEAHEPL